MEADERASFANNNKADLFISLHANASIGRAASGAEVFYLSLDGYSPEAQRLAMREEGAAVPTLSGGDRQIEIILWEMAQMQHIADSAAFAGLVETSLRSRVKMRAQAIQQAPFRVLVGANMPAVLVEMGFITNPAEEKLLASTRYQQQIVDALVESIVKFRERLDQSRRAEPGAPALPPAVPAAPATVPPRG
jgi:N-acetylmuramoyl-L-alanine amidase